MNVLIVIAILALVGLGFDQPLLWPVAAALACYLVRFYEGGGSGTAGSGSSTPTTGGGGGAGGYPKTYRDYRLRKERQERWDRRYRRTHPGSGR
ncbi:MULTISPECIES: hypothetical protein [unclassified Streptomyces]|uniref:hypothetical protein n=1 Tax=unclassified Streptomyces TaxID=2593676 RepID=UPI001CBDF4FF|nr:MULTISPECIES: hypothetical protein [unclassified Streptomyces]WPO74059.1 hypothetical protein R9806_27275 [Streptomyces sp. KN37]